MENYSSIISQLLKKPSQQIILFVSPSRFHAIYIAPRSHLVASVPSSLSPPPLLGGGSLCIIPYPNHSRLSVFIGGYAASSTSTVEPKCFSTQLTVAASGVAGHCNHPEDSHRNSIGPLYMPSNYSSWLQPLMPVSKACQQEG